MGELKDQADEYLRGRRAEEGPYFSSMFAFKGELYGLATDGMIWQAAWSGEEESLTIEGWRRVPMTRFEEEYVDS